MCSPAVLPGNESAMDSDLEFLVRFFNDQAYLFKTITMAEACERVAICDAICAQRGWYGGRFAASERHKFLRKRLFVERALYEDYTLAPSSHYRLTA